MNKALLLLCCLFAAMALSAQETFRYAAKVGPVDTPGFYSISLQPSLVEKSKADLSDLRVMAGNKHFAPYVLATGNPAWLDHPVPFTIFPAVAEHSATDTGTTLVVKNISSGAVDNLYVKIKNTAVERTLNLYGSDDLQHWFVIEENVPLQPVVLSHGSDYEQQLSFPPSDYRYFKLMINDRNKAPVMLIAAGIYEQSLSQVKYSEIKGVKFEKTDSGKTTLITVNPGGSYWVDMISLDIRAPKFYNRNVSFYDVGGGSPTLLAAGRLSPHIIGGVLPLQVRTARLLLKIDNEDNAPLNIAGIKLFQIERSALVYLDAHQTYHLLTGDSAAAAPTYDLKFFTDSATNRTKNITHDPIEKNELFIGPAAPHKPAIQKNVMIWVAIAGALVILSLLTWKMAGDVKNRT